MASLTSILPIPTNFARDREDDQTRQRNSKEVVAVSKECRAPPYGNRSGWIPRTQEDFGDGGAFPEIHVAQYPLVMGKSAERTTSNAVAVQLDGEGKIKYDVLARQGHSKDKIVYSKFTDLLPKEMTNEHDPELQKPNEEEVQDITEKTRQALEKLTQAKVAAAMPVRCADKKADAQFIRYTPSQQGSNFNSGAQQRVIRMVEIQKDPMSHPDLRSIPKSREDHLRRLLRSCIHRPGK